MSTERNDTTPVPSGAPGETGISRSYEPPSIAWEEPFEATIAATCGLVSGVGDECTGAPVV